MQVNLATPNSSLARQRQRLLETAAEDRAHAQELEQQSGQDLTKAENKQNSAAENRQKGQEYKTESDRLRKSGRDQSRHGLERLSEGSDRYAESFVKQEEGLANLQDGLDTITAANQTKSGALDKINAGIAEQVIHNGRQTSHTDGIADHNRRAGELADQKETSLGKLQGNNQAQIDNLNVQSERVADYILAGDDFAGGRTVKEGGVDKLGQAIEHRAQGAAHTDSKDLHELKSKWGSEDAERHQKAEDHLAFSALYESIKAQASQLNAANHRKAAERQEQSAQELGNQSQSLRSEAEQMMNYARQLECAGQHHVCVGQQMKCCPWTYCQGVYLERQGCAEIAEAQRLKAQAADLRAQAQQKAMEAEEAKVRAEQARAVSEEFEVQGHGQEVRSNILQERSDSHQEKAEKAEEYAAKQAVKAQEYSEKAQAEREQASQLQTQGVGEWAQGSATQRGALASQRGALDAHGESVTSEKALQSQATDETTRLSDNLTEGRRFLGASGSLLSKLNVSVIQERGSQAKVQEGIDEFRGGLDESKAGAEKAQTAADMLKEARELELEGLRLQNRGQKMLLEARPKMADAARLSAQSFDAFKTADSEEREAQELIDAGEQKLQAANVLRHKAAAYEDLAATKK